MKKPLLLFILLVSFFQVQAQRTIPYPIIFVHGWVGSDETWYGMGVMLKSHGLNVDLDDTYKRGAVGSVIDFHLNADGNNSSAYLNRTGGPYNYGDVYDYNSYINPVNDIFFVNFQNYTIPPSTVYRDYSNQAAAVKQGFAVGLAVKKVLNATKAKKVILVGHSMGGLAIREYLQNSVNWPFSEHKVAKYVSIATPHAGSNSNSGGILSAFSSATEWSEAVRDLRYKRDIDLFDRGVYLSGGYNILRLGRYNFFNVDVDCDGNSNGYVVGLNQKSIPTDLAYSVVIGKGGKLVLPTATGISGDDIVDGIRASIFDVSGNAIRYKNLTGDTFIAKEENKESSADQYYSSNDKSIFGTWHTKLTKQRFVNIYALDEPSRGDLAYEIELDKTYKGFLLPRLLKLWQAYRILIKDWMVIVLEYILISRVF